MDFREKIKELKDEYHKEKDADLEIAVLNAIMEGKLNLFNGKQFYGDDKQLYSAFCRSNKQLEYRTKKLREKLKVRLKSLL